MGKLNGNISRAGGTHCGYADKKTVFIGSAGNEAIEPCFPGRAAGAELDRVGNSVGHGLPSSAKHSNMIMVGGSAAFNSKSGETSLLK